MYTSGQICAIGDQVFKGKMGRDIGAEKGKIATRLCVMICLASIKQPMGSLNSIRQVIAVHGLINSDQNLQNRE